MFFFEKNSNRCVKSCSAKSIDVNVSAAVKSHFKSLGLYNFKSGFGWAYKRRGGRVISGWAYKRNKENFWEQRDKTYLRDELKLKYHYILS